MTTVSLKDLYKATGGGAGAEPLPVDTYTLEVTSVKVKHDLSQVVPLFKVIGGQYDGQKVLAGTFSFSSEGAASFAFQNLAGFGLDRAYFDSGKGLDDVARDITGVQVRVRLILHEWPKASGKYRNQIDPGKVEYLNRVAPAQTGVPQAAKPSSAMPPTPLPPPAPVAAPELASAVAGDPSF